MNLGPALSRLATRQSGVVSRAQLRALGVGAGAITYWLRCRRLVPLHRGVYAVGHASLSARGRAVAALLAAGPGAVLSHETAAAVWGFGTANENVHVTVIGREPRSRAGVISHTAERLHPDDLRRHTGLPLTAPARTLLDLAASSSLDAMVRALAEAQVLRLVTPKDLEAARARARSHPGNATLTKALTTPEPTRSELERALANLIAAAGLPRPRMNARVGRHEVDALWPDHRLIVETDGWAAHGHRLAFERDRARDAELQALGYSVLRFTWRQVTDERLLVAARIAQLLAGRS